MSYFKADDLSLHYQLLGKTEPKNTGAILVMIHGLVMDNLASWYFSVAPTLAQDIPVLLYDLRGHGKSSRPLQGYTLSQQRQDLLLLLANLAADKDIYLMGNSFGGLLALETAIHLGTRCRGLILVDAQKADESWKSDLVHSLSLQGEEQEGKIFHHFQHWLGRHNEWKRNRLAEQAHFLIHQTSLLQDISQSETHSKQQYQSLSCPILGLYGEQSELKTVALDYQKQLPQFEVHFFQDAGHSLIWEKTEELKQHCLQALRAWQQRSSTAFKQERKQGWLDVSLSSPH